MRESRQQRTRHARLIAAGLVLWGSSAAAMAAGIDKQDFTQVAKGHYLATVGDCGACHTLPGSGHLLAGGRPVETPFGTLLAPNITPDPTTGIGAWTDDEFINALTKGTGRNGTHLYPAMPYTYYTKITRDDALALRAYLNTLPAVHNPVRSNQLPFPFDIRATMVVWDSLYFKPGAFAPVAGKSAEWNRGAYLVEGLGHCGMCHTPKNFLGGDKTGARLQGYKLQGWFAADITEDGRRGIGNWSVQDIVGYLKSGHNAVAYGTGLMAETIDRSTSRMGDDDLKAIATYLKDQPGGEQANNDASTSAAPDQAVLKSGAQIYQDECSGCHAADGKSAGGPFPTLSGAAVVQQRDPSSLLRVVLRGTRNIGTKPAPTAPAMPAFAWVLNDDEVAAVLTYIRSSWGNAAPAVAAGDVGKARHALAERSD